MPSESRYKIVKLSSGAHCVHSLADKETFHPGIGPVAEAEALYVRQLRLPERVQAANECFTIWDVGLGAAANALTAIRLIRDHLASSHGANRDQLPKHLQLVSFDHSGDALEFALQHSGELGYFDGFEKAAKHLLQNQSAKFTDDLLSVEWTLVSGDFPARISRERLQPAPHAVMFDPHSPRKNPAMWTSPMFADLFHQLDPQRPCALATFTRSTMARAAMLLGGFSVGIGHPSGLKEETTVAANHPSLLDDPLDHRWLQRAQRSDSAEPLWNPDYRQSPLSAETSQRLHQHPQFQT